jgi:hypothetical protein
MYSGDIFRLFLQEAKNFIGEDDLRLLKFMTYITRMFHLLIQQKRKRLERDLPASL